MANWFGSSRERRYTGGDSTSSHELDYGEFFTQYIKSKQRDMDRQREQASKVSGQMKRDQERNR